MLEQHRDAVGAFDVDLEQRRRHERAHGHDPGRPLPVARAQRQRQRQPGTLREPTDHRLVTRHAVLGARGVEEIVDRGQRVGEALRQGDLRVGGVGQGRHVEPRESRRGGDRSARQHRDEATFGIEVAEQATQVALVGAVPVQEQQQAIRSASLHHVRDQIHQVLPSAAFRTCS